MSATIRDVALRAGVSHTTVSWVIHDRGDISEATKAKVRKAIEELDYHPNYNARSLVRGKTGVIAVVSSLFSSAFEMEVLKGIESVSTARADQYAVAMFSTMGRDEKVLKELVYGRRADAVILLSISPSPAVSALFKERGMPLVVVDEAGSEATEIQLNSFGGAYLATGHLLDRGRRRLAIVLGSEGGPGGMGLSQRERERGFAQALRDRGLAFEEGSVFVSGGFHIEDGREALCRILERMGDADGVFCAAGDLVAMGVMLEARTRGVGIPGRISLVGYDDLPSSALVAPALTTVRQPLLQIGKTAYEEAARALDEGAQERRRIIYDPVLIERDSA